MKEIKLTGASADILAENMAKLQQLFPEVFCEDRVDFDKLRAVLGETVDEDKERYNFTWWGKSRALRLAQTPSMGTLRPCQAESKDWDTTGNLYIEGDNLEVLKLLQKSYHSKVKMIYIDPPYNTGNDFVYKDDYKDPLQNYLQMTNQVDEDGRKLGTNSEASGRYHTNWLNMIYPRLRLARNLLREDGVIFISIDDNEVTNLGKVCDEIFGEENFISTLAVQLNPRGRHLDKFVAKTHESIVIYGKNINNNNVMFGLEKSGRMVAEYNREDKKGKYRLLGLRNRNQSFNPTTRPKLYYPIYINPKSLRVSIEKSDDFSIETYPITSEGIKTCWTWSKEKVSSESDLLIAEKQNDEWRIFRKDYLLDELGNVATTLIKSLWVEKEINNDYGKKELQTLLGKSLIDFPKSLNLIIKIINSSIKNKDYILDFFSGSATTAHAVMQLNAEDGGRRKFILVQLPELTAEESEAYKAGYANICEIGKERIRRAGEQIKAELIEKQKGQPSLLEGEKRVNPDELDIGFKVFKLDSSNLKKWNPDGENLEASLLDAVENFVDGRSELDLVYEILLKYGVDLCLPIQEFQIGDSKIYSVGGGALLLCLGKEIGAQVAEELVRLKEKLNPEITRVIFRDNGFTDDNAKTNAKELLRNAGVDEIVSI